jgi:peptidoglycan/LPS O-acetylase OafA/YrhL
MGIIRLILAISVVITHSSPILGLSVIDGTVAVKLFFVISGFYMALVISEKYAPEKNSLFWWDFYQSRFLRLYPIFVVVSLTWWIYFAFSLLYLGKYPMGNYGEIFSRIPLSGKAFVIFSNFTMIGQDLLSLLHVSKDGIMHIFYSKAADNLPDGSLWLGYVRTIQPAWSIGTEIWFYLLSPFLVRLSTKRIIFICILSLCINIFMEVYLDLPTYYFFPAQLFLFLIGVLGYKLPSVNHLTKIRGFVGLIILLFLLTISHLIGGSYYYLIIAICLATFIYPIFNLNKKSSVDRFIGELSYPIYMTHALVILIASNIFHKLFGMTHAPSYIVLIITMVVSTLLYFYVDKPLNLYRQRFVK